MAISVSLISHEPSRRNLVLDFSTSFIWLWVQAALVVCWKTFPESQSSFSRPPCPFTTPIVPREDSNGIQS